MTKAEFLKSKYIHDLWECVKKDNKSTEKHTTLSCGIQYTGESQRSIYLYEKGMLTLAEAHKHIKEV